MASRRCLNTLTRHTNLSLFFSNPQSLQPLKTLIPSLQLTSPHIFKSIFDPNHLLSRSFSSRSPHPSSPKFTNDDVEEHDDDDEVDDEDEDDDDDEIDGNVERESGGGVSRAYSIEEKIEEAASIGYKVIGPLQPGDRVFKPYEPAFAVVQIGSHQFKVSNGDCIYVEKLKFCEVNDKLVLNKVMMVGSPTLTIIGRPVLPDAAVHAVVEEHALDAKVIIFKKKRRKNYRRTNGHRQELTRLRITDIQGIEKPEPPSDGKTVKASTSKKVEKVAVAA